MNRIHEGDDPWFNAPAWAKDLTVGTCGQPIEISFDRTASILVRCSRDKHDTPGDRHNHEVRDFLGGLIAYMGDPPNDYAYSSPAFVIQEEP